MAPHEVGGTSILLLRHHQGLIVSYLDDTFLDKECKSLFSSVCVRQSWVPIEVDIIALDGLAGVQGVMSHAS